MGNPKFDDLPWRVWKFLIVRRTTGRILAMTEPEGTPQDAELDTKSSTDEPTADVNPAAGEEGTTADYQEEGEEKAAADYQTRLEEFDNVETSVPVVSLPVESRELDKSDLEV
jgi:hypothetical protein